MLNSPPILLGATLVFWGYETGQTAVGVILAVVLEAAGLTRRRWDISREEFYQLWNITVLLFAGAAAYVFAVNDGLATVGDVLGAGSFSDRSRALDQASQTVVAFLRWLPAVFFPFTAAQAFSNQRRIDWRTFSWYLRRRSRLGAQPPGAAGEGVNTAFPFFGLCLISASTVNEPGPFFLGAISVLVGWALWRVRSARAARVRWAVLMAAAIALAFLIAHGLRNLQQVVDDLQVRALNNIGGGNRDSRSAQTAIGQIGRMKGSGRIMLRLEFPPESRVPHLLREATYNFYHWPDWRAAGLGRDFAQVSPATSESSWVFTGAPARDAVRITAYLNGGQGTLALPHGLASIDQLNVADLKTNHLATVRVDSGPGLLDYTARSSAAATFDGPPDEALDLNIPPAELPAVNAVALEMQLMNRAEAERPETVLRFFGRHFAYSLYQDASVLETNREIRTPLAHFLLNSRTGHCEYFATATALLLRRAGIPARYTVGYSVEERAGNGRYVVRGRHAHAWCVYYDRTARLWREIDTTPGTWLAAESERRSFLEPVQDALSWVWLQVSRLRWGLGGVRVYLFYAAMVALALAVGQFLRTRRRKVKPAARTPDEARLRAPGADSEYYLIEQRISELGLERLPSETPHAWRRRIRDTPHVDSKELAALVDLHYRLRFDPEGLPDTERTRLRLMALALLDKVRSGA